jgi:7-carboxy-7-deazaguanine synthase
MTLKVYEIFHSVQGESSRIGLPTVFVRLTGCPMRCVYCDTEYAFSGGSNMTLDQIMEKVASFGARYVTVTGGEPLAQKECLPLLTRLCDAGYEVSLETGGAIDTDGVDARVAVILDVKTPGSGEAEKNRWGNLHRLKPQDEVKFVLCDRADYDWARQIMADYGIAQKCSVLFSPVHGSLDAAKLAEWILADRLPVRMQVQLHKILWGEKPGV